MSLLSRKLSPSDFYTWTTRLIIHSSGIYVPDDKRWPKHFRGMGIRIEDSVCVGEEAPLVLSVEAVKEVSVPVKSKWSSPDSD